MNVFTVELNGERLNDLPYTTRDEATAYATGYFDALDNNELVTDGVCFIVTFILDPDHPDGSVEAGREQFH